MRSLGSILLLAALAGCSTVPNTVREAPPASLLEPCPTPQASLSTNGELAAYALALKHALQGCNNQLEALREWARSPE